jgi:hypothetical protein
MHSLTSASPGIRTTPQQASGEKVLVKALASIVNREGKKKAPLKKIYLSLSESV